MIEYHMYIFCYLHIIYRYMHRIICKFFQLLKAAPSYFPRRKNCFLSLHKPSVPPSRGKRRMPPTCRAKNCLPRKMWKENSAFTRRHSPTGIWKASVRYIRISAGVSFMSAPYWKSILHPSVSKPRNQSSDGLLRPAYPR